MQDRIEPGLVVVTEGMDNNHAPRRNPRTGPNAAIE